MIVAFTGHRIDKIAGKEDKIKQLIREKLLELKPDKAISGMAVGVDQIAAEVCIELGIPFIAAIPFKYQYIIWPQAAQDRYWEILQHAESIEIVGGEGSVPEQMQNRNEWMVDNGDDLLLAVFDGSKGGTKNCIRYAEIMQKPVVKIENWK